MKDIEPLTTLFEVPAGPPLQMPDEISRLYGPLYMPTHDGRPHVISDYVSTLDGVVSLGAPSFPGAGASHGSPGDLINGLNAADQMVLALVHAVADVVLIGDAGVRGNPHDVRRADAIYPPLAKAFQQARQGLGMPPQLPVAILSPEGGLDPAMPLFHVSGVRIAVITTESTAPGLLRRGFPKHVTLIPLPTRPDGLFSARAVLTAVQAFQPARLILSDAGPRFMAHLIAEHCLDELFLTIAPQLAGRGETAHRPGLVQGKEFAPLDPRWAKLVSAKQAGHHLLLRYALN